MEAAGVELFSVLTARKLLILRMARGAKKAPLPIPLYVYCTKNPFEFLPATHSSQAEYPTFVLRVRRQFAPSNDPLSKKLTLWL